MKLNKEVIVNRKGYKPVKAKVKIIDSNIYFNVKGEIMFVDLCQYILENTPILKINYERSAPYKLEKIKNRKGDKFSHKTFNLKYLLLKDGEFKEFTNHIIDLHTVNTKVKGTFKCFIPDLFLVMEDLNYIKQKGNGYYEIAREFSDKVSFGDDKLSPDYLVSQGYVVPDNYMKKFAAIK